MEKLISILCSLERAIQFNLYEVAKHPVPKRKMSKTGSKTRFASYKVKHITRIKNELHLTECGKCGAMKKVHHVCEACGTYKGRPVLDTKSGDDKVKKIQAT